MPRIEIRDTDLTTSVRSVNTEYAVYVPGLCNRFDEDETKKVALTAAEGPVLFETLQAFVERVGSAPATLLNSAVDRSFIYACELLSAGLPVVYQVILDPVEAGSGGNAYYAYTEAQICSQIGGTDFQTNMEKIKDRGMFDISFITTGGYPTIYNSGSSSTAISLGANGSICNCAKARGDSFALIDVTDEYEIHKPDDVKGLPLSESTEDSFIVFPGTSYTPSSSNYTKPIFMPGSFKYLLDFAKSIQGNASWFAVAGAKRGLVSGESAYVVTNDEADNLQPEDGRSVNAITQIRPYGNCIWGNRTLAVNTNGTTANSYINVRQCVHEIKRHLYKTAKALMFSPNDDVLWVNFKNNVTPLLDRMLSGQGISSYRLTKVASSARATLTAKITISPIEAVEAFDITIELTDSEVTAEG